MLYVGGGVDPGASLPTSLKAWICMVKSIQSMGRTALDAVQCATLAHRSYSTRHLEIENLFPASLSAEDAVRSSVPIADSDPCKESV